MILVDEVLQQFLHYYLKLVHDVLHSHIDLHFLENRHLWLYILHHIELLHYLLLSINRNVLNVDHHFIYWNVMCTTYSQLQLHRSHQHLVDAMVFLVELSLLVIYAIQDKLQVWDLGAVWVEIGEEADVEKVRSVDIALLVDRLDLLQ